MKRIIIILMMFGFLKAQVNQPGKIKFLDDVFFKKVYPKDDNSKVLTLQENGKLSYSTLDSVLSNSKVNFEIIGNILYLFQNGDTLMADLSNVGDTSLWEIASGKLQPKNEVQLKISYQNTTLGWDSLIFGAFSFPYYGVAESLGSFKYINGIFDLSPIQSKKMVLTATNPFIQNTIATDSNSFEMFTKFSNENYAKIVGDTTELELSFNDSITITLDANSISLLGIKEYINDASADTDTKLPSYATDGKYGLYKLTGDRTLYLKP